MTTLTAGKTVLNIKIDRDLKCEAQSLAKSIGLPISTIVTGLLKQFTIDRSITFDEGYSPNLKTAKNIDKAVADHKTGNTKSFDSMDAFISDLQS